jgi:hypothetical protein
MGGMLVHLPSRRLSHDMYYIDEQIKEVLMDGTCGTYEGKQSRIQDFGGYIWRKETAWKNYA